MNGKLIGDWLAYLVIRLFVSAIQAVRIETCELVAQILAFIACDVVRLRRRVLDDNLQIAFPQSTVAQRDRLTRAMWEHLFVMVCEIAHAPRKIHRHNWHDYVTFHRKRELVRHLIDARPLVMLSAHFGNFEMGGYVAGLLGFPSHTVARTLDNPFLDRYVRRFREANGQYLLPKQGSAWPIDHVLRTGGLLLALGDQHAGPKGCWVPFFGKPASYHKAMALFPLIHEAPLAVVYSMRSGRPLHFEIGMVGDVDPQAMDERLRGVEPMTQWYNDLLEDLIRRAPQQYWWVHRRWKGEAPRRKLATPQAA